MTKTVHPESIETQDHENENEKLIIRKITDNAIIKYQKDFLSISESSELYEHLISTIEWNQSTIKMWGKTINIPRLQTWMSNEGIKASLYLKTESLKWDPKIKEIKKRIESILHCEFDYVLLNYYRDGNDYISYHSDGEAIEQSKGVIASISLGATRRFLLRHNESKEIIEYSLFPGSLLVMDHITQMYWKHSVPKQKKIIHGRINLTFRIH